MNDVQDPTTVPVPLEVTPPAEKTIEQLIEELPPEIKMQIDELARVEARRIAKAVRKARVWLNGKLVTKSEWDALPFDERFTSNNQVTSRKRKTNG